MLRISSINSSKNLLTLVDVAEKDKIVGKSVSNKRIKNLLKFQKSKNIKILSKARRLKQMFLALILIA